MKLRRVVKWIVIVLALILIVPPLVVVLVNLRDEALSPAAQSQLTPPAVAREGNAALALWALDAPEGVDPVLVGRVVFDAYQALARETPTRNDWPIKRPYVATPFQFPTELACSDGQSACVSAYQGHAELVHQLAVKDAYLLERIAAIDSASNWHELAPPPTLSSQALAPEERLADLTGIYSLSLGVAALDIGEGRVAPGIARLEQDVRIARRVLAASDSLLCKMVAASMLRRVLLAYSELLSSARASPATVSALASSIEHVAVDLTPDERTLVPQLGFEARTLRIVVLELARGDTSGGGTGLEKAALWATPFLLKPNATSNLQAELIDAQKPLMQTNARDFARTRESSDAEIAQRGAAIAAFGWSSLYNPLGRELASNPPLLASAAARVHDDEVLLRAVRVKARMLARVLPFSEAASYLAQTPHDLADPYSGQAFPWLPADAAIGLTQMGAHPVKSLAVPLASKP
jgi:hypothetical protein